MLISSISSSITTNISFNRDHAWEERFERKDVDAQKQHVKRCTVSVSLEEYLVDRSVSASSARTNLKSRALQKHFRLQISKRKETKSKRQIMIRHTRLTINASIKGLSIDKSNIVLTV